jgi:serine/threonine protein kinase
MPPACCPDRTTLLAFVEGRLPEEAFQSLAEHISGCPRCPDALQRLERALGQAQLESDPLLRELRRLDGLVAAAAEEPSFATEREHRQAVQRLHGLWGSEVRERLTDLSGAEPTPWPATPPLSGGKTPPATVPHVGPAPEEGAPQEMPDRLGPYQLEKLIGSGGMGVVYRALDTRQGREVAVKIIRSRHLSHPVGVERFRDEVRALGRLSHPNIVRLYDADRTDQLSYLVTEYVEGEDLGKRVRRLGRLPPEEACEYVRQTAAALQYLHRHGQVHRDIKPANLLLTPTGQVKILDFGLALLQREERGGDGAGWLMGTPEFMAPEQWADSRAVDIRADIYSLGCTLFHLLRGHPPFTALRGASPDTGQAPATPRTQDCPALVSSGEAARVVLQLAHLREPPPPLCRNASVPQEVERIYRRCLQKDLNRRYRTPQRLAEDLEGALEEIANLPRHLRVWRGVVRATRRVLAWVVLPFQSLGQWLCGWGVIWWETRPRVTCVLEFYSGDQARCLVDIGEKQPLPVSFPAAVLRARGLGPNQRFEWRMRKGGAVRARDIKPLPAPTLTPQEQQDLERRYQEDKKNPLPEKWQRPGGRFPQEEPRPGPAPEGGCQAARKAPPP